MHMPVIPVNGKTIPESIFPLSTRNSAWKANVITFSLLRKEDPGSSCMDAEGTWIGSCAGYSKTSIPSLLIVVTSKEMRVSFS